MHKKHCVTLHKMWSKYIIFSFEPQNPVLPVRNCCPGFIYQEIFFSVSLIVIKCVSKTRAQVITTRFLLCQLFLIFQSPVIVSLFLPYRLLLHLWPLVLCLMWPSLHTVYTSTGGVPNCHTYTDESSVLAASDPIPCLPSPLIIPASPVS